MKIYLAGGFRSGWQSKVIKRIQHHDFINPAEKEVNEEWTLDKIGVWDLHYIRNTDVVFAYMENTNPSGIGLSVEVGYAHGLGKTVILILEPGNKTIPDRYLSFIKKASDIVFDNFEDGIKFLLTFAV